MIGIVIMSVLTACATNKVSTNTTTKESNTKNELVETTAKSRRIGGNEVVKNNQHEMILIVKNLYSMGDSDSRLTAKATALNDAKVVASEIFGTAVEHELRMDNGEISMDRLKTYSIAQVNANILIAEFFQKDGNQFLYLTSKLSIDKDQLINNLDLIARSGRISWLESENKALNKQLQHINSKLKNHVSNISEQTKLINTRNQIYIDMEKNNDSIRKSINKKELLSSVKNVKAEYANLTDYFNRYYVDYVIENMKVNLGDPYVVSYEKEDVILGVDYNLNIDPNSVFSTIERFYTKVGECGGTAKKYGNWSNGVSNNIGFKGHCLKMKNYRVDGPLAKDIGEFLYKNALFLGIEISGFDKRAYLGVITTYVQGGNFFYEGSGTVKFRVAERSLARLTDVKASFIRGRKCSFGACVKEIN